MKIIELVHQPRKKHTDIYVYDTLEGAHPQRHLVGQLTKDEALFIEALENSRYVTYINNHAPKVLVPETPKKTSTTTQKPKTKSKKEAKK